jgi:hypothetical protein
MAATKGVETRASLGEYISGRVGGELEAMRRTRTTRADSTYAIVPEPRPRAPWLVAYVEARPGFRLFVRFMDGLEGEVEMGTFLRGKKIRGTVFEPLRDPALFEMAYLDLCAVTWPNGTDLAPDAMHDEIKKNGKWVL